MAKKILTTYKRLPVSVKLSFWTFISLLVQKGISLLTVPIFTRMMSTEQYGEYSLYLSWLNIFEIFTTMRLYAGVYNKGLSKYAYDKDGFALSMQYTTSILTVIVFAIYFCLHRAINSLTEISTFVMILMFVELFFKTPMQFWSVRQRYDFKYKNVVIATIALAIANPLLGIVLVSMAENKSLARIISLVVVQVCFGALFYIINLKKGRYIFKKDYMKFAVLFNIPLIPHYFSEYILNQSDRIMIQKIVGYSAAGIYSVAYSAGMVLQIISNSVNQALVPWLYHKLECKSFSDIRKYINIIAITMLCPVILFVALAPELIYILAGEEYAAATAVLIPVASSVYLMMLYTLFANVEFFYDRNKYTLVVTTVSALTNIITNWIFINKYGMVAAGFTTFGCYMLYALGHLFFAETTFREEEHTSLFDIPFILTTIILLSGIVIFYSCSLESRMIRYLSIVVILLVLFIKRNVIIATLNDISSSKKRHNNKDN